MPSAYKIWFDQQPETTQKKMMGKGMHEAYKAGRFEFPKLSVQKPEEVYGTMRFQATLKELIGDDGSL